MISEHPISIGLCGLSGYQWEPRDRGVTESGLTGPTHPHYRIYRTNYHSPQEFNYNSLTNNTN